MSFKESKGRGTPDRGQPTGVLELQEADEDSSTVQDLCRATRHDNDRDAAHLLDSCVNADDDGGAAKLTKREIKK